MPFSYLHEEESSIKKLCNIIINSNLNINNSAEIFLKIMDYVTHTHTHTLMIESKSIIIEEPSKRIDDILEEFFRIIEDILKLVSTHLSSLTEEKAELFMKHNKAYELRYSYSILYISCSNKIICIKYTRNFMIFTINISVESGIMVYISSPDFSNIEQSHFARVAREKLVVEEKQKNKEEQIKRLFDNQSARTYEEECDGKVYIII